jgi:hypothetical protein
LTLIIRINIDNTNSWVLRWRLFIEDFHLTLYYVPGVDNVEADGLWRLTTALPPLAGQEDLSDNNNLLQFEQHMFNPEPDPNNPIYPLDYNIIAEHQNTDQQLSNLRIIKEEKYPSMVILVMLVNNVS